MLHLLTGLKVILSGSHFRFLSNAMTAAERRQRRIGNRCAAGSEFLMDPDQVALATGQQFQDLLTVGFGFLGTYQHRHFW